MLDELRALTAVPGPSGDEGAVAAHVLAALRARGLHAVVDGLGDVVLAAGAPRGLVTAHLDQVGFMVSRAVGDRTRCLPVGDAAVDRRCRARVVADGATRATGWLEPAPEASEAAVLRCDAEQRVEVGDRVLYDATFEAAADGTVAACALDDRVGCAILLRAAAQLAARRPDLAFAWTVREELDGSGAIRVARELGPAWTIAVDTTSAMDGAATGESTVVLGGGPAMTLLDEGMVAHRPLLEAFTAVAAQRGIPWQPEVVAEGLSEAGMIGGALGVPGLALLVPLASAHGPVERANLRDVEQACALLVEALADPRIATSS